MRKIHLSIIFLTLALSISAKEKEYKPHRLKASFSFQTDIHLTTEKNFTGKSRLMGNSYLTGTVRNDFFELGARFEEMSYPLPGREIEKGLGVPNLYLKGKYKWAEITVGDVYEQFGSGMLLRAYEDRNLGLDNAIRGGRIVLNSWQDNNVIISIVIGKFLIPIAVPCKLLMWNSISITYSVKGNM